IAEKRSNNMNRALRSRVKKRRLVSSCAIDLGASVEVGPVAGNEGDGSPEAAPGPQARHTCVQIQNGGAPPASQARPQATLAPLDDAYVANSSARRVLPAPASPTTRWKALWPPSIASNAAMSWDNSRSRPTNADVGVSLWLLDLGSVFDSGAVSDVGALEPGARFLCEGPALRIAARTSR